MKPRTKYKKGLSQRWIARGLCPNCGARPPEPNRRTCVVCLNNSLRATQRKRALNPDSFKDHYKARKLAGLCVSCGSPENPRARGLLCDGCSKTERQRAVRIKADVIKKYGGSCKCCGESKVAFLTVDHINNDGTALRKSGAHSGGGHFYKRLLKLPVNPTLQILCWNCNMGRKITGVCPHRDDTFHQEAVSRPRWTRRSTLLRVPES
jgi:hypothetical protein